jgi:hypothetical protein
MVSALSTFHIPLLSEVSFNPVVSSVRCLMISSDSDLFPVAKAELLVQRRAGEIVPDHGLQAWKLL